jgi:hypothetical protein
MTTIPALIASVLLLGANAGADRFNRLVLEFLKAPS